MANQSPPFARHLKFFSVALIVLIWGLVSYDLSYLYQERERNARQEVANVARAMEVYVGQTLQNIDFSLTSLAGAIGSLSPARRTQQEVSRLLEERGVGYESSLEFLYIDAEGVGVASSASGYSPGRSYTDREYFKTHLESGKGRLYVGGPLEGKVLGKKFFPVSRAVLASDGRRLGVVMASVEAKQFNSVLERFSLGPNGAISLIHLNGKVIVRSPDFEKHFAQDVSGSRLFTELLPLAREGDYEVATATDGMTRLIHYTRVGDLPLVLAAGFAREDIQQALSKDVVSHFAVGIAFSLLVALGAGLLLRAQRLNARAVEQLHDSEERYHGLYDTMGDGMLLRSPEGVVLDCNPAFCRMLGYAREELLGQTTARFTPPGYEEVEAAANAQIEARNYSDEFEKEYLHRDGRHRWVRIRAWRHATEEGKTVNYWGLVRDVTEQRQTLAQLELSRKIIESTSEAMLVTDAQERILAVNPAFEKITGYPALEVIGQKPSLLSSGRHDAAFYHGMWEALKASGHWEGEVWDRRKNGEIYPKYLRINAIHELAGGAVLHYVGVFSDITERKKQEERIEHMAHHDALTGLPNRAALEIHLAAALAMARRNGTQVALLFIDLDNFKTINDSLGHHAGDLLLCEVADRLRSAIRESDQVARLGGDEFVVVVEGIKRSDAVAGVASKIIQAVGQPCLIEEQSLHTSPSIGISIFPDDGDSADVLMRNADTAMYYAKSSGRNNFQFFAEPMNTAANKRLHLESELWRALAENQLLLHYQPQVDLLSGRIVGVEALVRWNHPERGMISPADFIPVAEESGLILPIGHWVLLEACKQAKAWLDSGADMGDMAVNISAHQFKQPEFPASVRRILEETGLPPGRLELEITESAVMHSADSSVNVLVELKAMGVKLAIDDFGTGYSSLAYLRRFPIDRLKIDRSFVADLEGDQDAASLVSSIIALGQSLGLRLVAEGVETSGQADFLREKSCERVQGFHFFRPASAENVFASLEQIGKLSGKAPPDISGA